MEDRPLIDDEIAALIPELDRWDDGSGIGVDAWLQLVGSTALAVAFGRLFWPDFKIHEDCILRRDADLNAFEGFMTSKGGRRQAVEAAMNHVHLDDLFLNETTEPPYALQLHLGRLMQATWTAKLRRDFPDRDLVVTLVDEGTDDWKDYQLTVFHAVSDGDSD